MTFAAVLVGEIADGLLVALPAAAATLWPGTVHNAVPDAPGAQGIDVVLSEIPPEAIFTYDEASYMPEQLETFWTNHDHMTVRRTSSPRAPNSMPYAAAAVLHPLAT